VARDVAADLVPPSRRPWIIAVVVAVLGVLVFTLFRACSG
jgi:hypothetical protein